MIKEHAKTEYAEYLKSLETDERELELEQWKLRLIKSVLTRPCSRTGADGPAADA